MSRALRPDKEVPTELTPLESPEPWQRGAPDIGRSVDMPSKFNLEPWSEITFDSSEEWLVKRFFRGAASR
jgi:hypothetical protein